MTALPKVRSGEVIDDKDLQGWRRSERFFEKNRMYYFATREGIDVGPFASRNMAKRALELYKYVVNECSATGAYASSVVTHL